MSDDGDDGDKRLNAVEAAAFLGVGVSRLHRLRKSGNIAGTRAGGWRNPWQFRAADLMAYAQRTTTQTDPLAAEASPETPPAAPPPPDAPPFTLAEAQRAMSEMSIKAEAAAPRDADDRDEVSQAPLVRMANAILVSAIENRASDIHIERGTRNTRIRNRVDGILREVMAIPPHIHNPVINRFCVMADLNPFLFAPQVGRVPITHYGKDYSLRVFLSAPSLFGRTVTIRIFENAQAWRGLKSLPMPPPVQATLEDMLYFSGKGGLILVAGPHGAGTTTTAFNLLNRINSVEKKIVTLEEPIEYQLSGIHQTALRPAKGLTASAVLPHILQGGDADIFFLHAAHDRETALAALDAAQEGVLTLMTLAATPNAPTALQHFAERSGDIKRAARLVTGVLFQKLLRTLCSHCKESYPATTNDLHRFGYPVAIPINEELTLWKGKGCEQCGNTGYKGRTALFEMLRMNSEIAELLRRGAPISDLHDAAHAGGMMPLHNIGWERVLEGVTTPEELYRVGAAHP